MERDLGKIRYTIIELAKAHARRLFKSRQVTRVKLAEGLRTARHVVILVVHNEADRLPFLLGYYRRLGFSQFLIVDNESTDNLAEVLSEARDVSLFRAEGSYRDARFGNDWINYVLSKYCHKKWVLYVDADEFLIFDGAPEVAIDALTESLERRRLSTLHTVILDMYSDKALSENTYAPGSDPLTVCPLFDAEGYETRYEELSQTTWIKGGVRARLFFDDPWLGPALNKTPLVSWRRHYAFIKSSHQLVPPRLNGPGPQSLPALRGALLHFKFLASFREKVAAEQARQQHTAEYRSYQRVVTQSFVGASTRRMEGWRTAVDAGLVSSEPVGTRGPLG